MIGDPKIIVTCDKCSYEEDHGLTSLAGGGWDARGLEESLRRQGWCIEEDGCVAICSDCQEEEKENHE